MIRIALILVAAIAFYRFLSRLTRKRDPLDQVVTHFGAVPMTMRQLFQGVLWIGGTGSAKTTTAVRVLIDLLKVPWTGAALYAVKRGEPEHLWKAVQVAGRTKDVILVGREHIATCKINALWLAYEANRSVEAAVELVDSLIEIASGGSKGGGDGKDVFFRRSALNIVRFGLNLLTPLGESFVDFNSLGDLAKGAPSGLFYVEVVNRVEAILPGLPLERRKDVERARAYLEGPWSTLAGDTKSGIIANISVLVELFGSYPLRELLTTPGAIRPEWAWERRKIFLFADSIERYGIEARILQCAWKFILQRAVARRDVRRCGNWFFSFQDEASQLILRDYDDQHQSSARGYLCANVLLLQNLNQLFSGLGNRDAAESYISNLRNRVVMQGDAKSVKDVCGWFGEGLRVVPGGGDSKPYDPADLWGGNIPQSNGRFEYAPLVTPEMVSSLRPGGPHGWAEAIVYRAGTQFKSGYNHQFTKMRQRFL